MFCDTVIRITKSTHKVLLHYYVNESDKNTLWQTFELRDWN